MNDTELGLDRKIDSKKKRIISGKEFSELGGWKVTITKTSALAVWNINGMQMTSQK